MDGSLFRICGLAILCLTVGLIVRQIRPELSGLVRIAAAVLIFGTLVSPLAERLETVIALLGGSGVEVYAQRMLRVLGIAFLTTICANVCRDSGENTLAGGVELAGKLAIVGLSIPLIEEILECATQLLGSA